MLNNPKKTALERKIRLNSPVSSGWTDPTRTNKHTPEIAQEKKLPTWRKEGRMIKKLCSNTELEL